MNTKAEARPRRILVVDDNTTITDLLKLILTREGYAVAVAGDGFAALAQVLDHPPDLIFLDLNMPNLGGYEVCRRLKGEPATRGIPVVILTGQSELPSKLKAWDCGADDFLTKPFQVVEVTTRCRSLLRLRDLTETRDSAEEIVFALARSLEAKSPYTHGHSERVTRYALALADAVGLAEDDREVLCRGALLHDIGKISIPDAILNKPGPLTEAEYNVIKDHTVQGVRIVEPLPSLRDALPLIRWHHERLDGKGYPDQLRGDAIALPVRILSVADFFDSLASDRPYRANLPHEMCLEILRKNAAEGGLDPDLVKYFTGLVDSGHLTVKQAQSDLNQRLLPEKRALCAVG